MLAVEFACIKLVASGNRRTPSWEEDYGQADFSAAGMINIVERIEIRGP
jgi:hypothetical protein